MSAKQIVTHPAEEDIARLAQQSQRANALALEHVGRKLGRGHEAIEALQKLIDTGALKKEDTYDLQCLGVAFGMELADAIPDLDWVIVEDEYGRDPALQYKDRSYFVFPVTMISKRVEDGETVDIQDLFDGTRAHVAKAESISAGPTH